MTPNIPEAEILSNMKIASIKDMIKSANKINSEFNCAVLLKGGHNINEANDLLYFEEGKFKWFNGKRIETNNTHGTGCTLSSAVTANLAKGFSLEDSVLRAKNYISEALGAMLDLGKGCGPMKHSFNLTGIYSQDRNIVERLMDSVKDIWPEYNNHPFVKGIELGNLDSEKFRHYIIQDYLYLNEYSKVFALGITKAKTLSTVRLFSKVIDAITNVEMNIHNGYMGRLNVSQEELDKTPRALANFSYTSYMLRVAYDEGEAEILAAILSCALSYEDIAKRILKNNPKASEHEFYGNWLKCYAGKDYSELNQVLVKALEEAAKDYSTEQIDHLAEIFRYCSLYEMGFWDMAYKS